MWQNLKLSQNDGLLNLHLLDLISIIDGVKTLNVWLTEVEIWFILPWYNSCWGDLPSSQLRASKPPLRKYGLNNSWFLILIFKRKPTCVYSPSKLNRTLFARCSWLSFLQLKRISPSIKKCIGFKIFFPTRGISFRISSLSFDTFGKDSILTLFLTFD